MFLLKCPKANQFIFEERSTWHSDTNETKRGKVFSTEMYG